MRKAKGRNSVTRATPSRNHSRPIMPMHTSRQRQRQWNATLRHPTSSPQAAGQPAGTGQPIASVAVSDGHDTDTREVSRPCHHRHHTLDSCRILITGLLGIHYATQFRGYRYGVGLSLWWDVVLQTRDYARDYTSIAYRYQSRPRSAGERLKAV